MRANISLLSAALEARDRTAKELYFGRSGAIAYLALEREGKSRQFVAPQSVQEKCRAS